MHDPHGVVAGLVLDGGLVSFPRCARWALLLALVAGELVHVTLVRAAA